MGRDRKMPTDSLVLTIVVVSIFAFFAAILAYVDMQSWRHPPSRCRPEFRKDAEKIAVIREREKA
jgi:hypothetical protein